MSGATMHALGASPVTFLAVVGTGTDKKTQPAAEAELLGRHGAVLGKYGPSWDAIGWSANRKVVAWLGSTGVMVANADGSGRRLLVPLCVSSPTRCTHRRGLTCSAGPSFSLSPQGTELLVADYGPKTNELVVASVATGKIREIEPTRPCVFYGVSPDAWSPNGRRITFSRGEISGVSPLYVARPNGADSRVLFEPADADDGVATTSWSPDGRMLAFAAEARDPKDPTAAVINLASGHITRFDLQPGVAQVPAWSPDSRRVAFTQFDGPAVTVTVTSGLVHYLGSRGFWESWTRHGLFVLSSNGRTLLRSADGKAKLQPVFTVPDGGRIGVFQAS